MTSEQAVFRRALLLAFLIIFGITFWNHTPPKGGLKGTKKRIAIVRPTSPDGADSLLAAFALWDTYPPCDPNQLATRQYSIDLYISLSRQTKSSLELNQAFKDVMLRTNGWAGCINSLSILDAKIPQEEDIYNETIQLHDRMWVNGPNAQFRSLFHHIREASNSECFFLMEADTFPRTQHWLDMLVREVDDSKPFGILGSKYQGHAWDTFIDKMPRALVDHVNGNAFYNASNKLLNRIVEELEIEKDSFYGAVSYDYRISQIVTEGSKGIVSKFPFPEQLKDVDEKSLALPDKMDKFQKWWGELGDDNFVKESKIIANFGAVKDVIEDIGDFPIVHGKQYHPLKKIAQSGLPSPKTSRRLQCPSYDPNCVSDGDVTDIPPLPNPIQNQPLPNPSQIQPTDMSKFESGTGDTTMQSGISQTQTNPLWTNGNSRNLASKNPPSVLSKLSNYKDTSEASESSDTPVFWHIPKSGGSTVKDVLGACYRFVMATNVGILNGHDNDNQLGVFYRRAGRYVNVDTTTVPGIERASALGFAGSGLADAVVTSYPFNANILFNAESQGRLFTVFRHPIERAVSMFNYLPVATWEKSYRPEMKNWTLEQYATSNVVENNWLTRFLSGKPAGVLTDQDLEAAKEVLANKFIIGLMDQMPESMERFEKFFQFKYRVQPGAQERCRQNYVTNGANVNVQKKKEKKKLAPGDKDWKLLAKQNQYDLQVYEYARQLFGEQESMFADIPDGIRNVDATCCKCDPPTFPLEGYECPSPPLEAYA